MSTTPPGWYDDGHGALRWWDGAAWTEHVAEPDPLPAEGADAAAEAAPVPPELAPDVDPAVAMSAGVPSPAETPDYSAYGASGTQGAYGGYTGSGAFVSATGPRTSRAWIVWLVLGLVLLGIVIAAAVLIPLALMGAATSGASGSSTVVVEETADIAGADEERALEVVALYDAAWQGGDCDGYLASTTEELRQAAGFVDCETFVQDAASFAEGLEDYVVHIDDVETAGADILVASTETFTSMYDEDGNLMDARDSFEQRYEYRLVSDGSDWAIADVTLG